MVKRCVTSLPHDLVKAKVLSLVNWCLNRESKTYLCTSDKAYFFSNKKYDSHKCWTCAELCEAFTFLAINIYVQCVGMVYQQIVGIYMGTNSPVLVLFPEFEFRTSHGTCFAPLIEGLFVCFFCYERDFMSPLHKSKQHHTVQRLMLSKGANRWIWDDITRFPQYLWQMHMTTARSGDISKDDTSIYVLNYFSKKNLVQF